MTRMIWKGVIAFGLVHVPVALYPAAATRELQLSLLDRRDFSPVGYQRVNARTGEAIAAADVVRGYEYAQDQYVVVSEEDLRQANIAATHTVEIAGFVDIGEIQPYQFDTPYYLEPGKGGERGYALLREALRRSGRVGLANVVIRTRQHLAVVFPLGRALVLNTLRFADEIRPVDELELPDENLQRLGVASGEVEMATRLIDVMAENWTPERYRDTYREDLLGRIRQKVESGQATEPVGAEPEPAAAAEAPGPAAPEAPSPAGAEVVDLMAMLRRSLELERSTRQAANDRRARPRRA